MLKRRIELYLDTWKKRNHLPLIIKGARQIGKTTSILNFAQKNYSSVIYINFYENPEYKQIFNDGYNVNTIIRNLSFIHPNFQFIPHDTLIFFDEIQEYMDATTSLKFFSIDNNYDVICSGSSLGVKYKNISSVSVGYKEDIEMYSLDFEEFLWANGYSEIQINSLIDNIIQLKPYSSLIINQMNKLFMDYIIVGGMPAIVNHYIQTNNFSNLLDMQKQLLKDYDDDIGKYATGLESSRIRNMFRHIAPQLGKDNHKFQITKLGHGARSYQYKGCEEWLSDAGVINTCYCLNQLELPLNGNENQENYRIYFSDTSLLLASLDDESQNDLRLNKNLNVYKGALYENFCAEALRKQEYGLYYYRSEDSRTELDFLIRIKDNIVPIEVKAGKTKARSLSAVINDESLSYIKYGIKYSMNNIGADNNIITLPYFTLFLLKQVLSQIENTPLQNYINECIKSPLH